MKRSLIALSALILFVAPLVPANAQAGPYPALQPTRVVTREYNFALADYNGGTGLLVQWRERLSDPKMQFTSEIGILDGIGASGLSLGGSLHYQLRTAVSFRRPRPSDWA